MNFYSQIVLRFCYYLISFYRNVIRNHTSTTNLKNLEDLKSFPYHQEFRKNSKNNKMLVVYICGFHNCGKEFMRTWNLLDHLRMHYGIRPFSCSICQKSFTQKGNLRKHMEQHSKPNLSSRRKFECVYCQSKFTEKYNFKVIKLNIN